MCIHIYVHVTCLGFASSVSSVRDARSRQILRSAVLANPTKTRFSNLRIPRQGELRPNKPKSGQKRPSEKGHTQKAQTQKAKQMSIRPNKAKAPRQLDTSFATIRLARLQGRGGPICAPESVGGLDQGSLETTHPLSEWSQGIHDHTNPKLGTLAAQRMNPTAPKTRRGKRSLPTVLFKLVERESIIQTKTRLPYFESHSISRASDFRDCTLIRSCILGPVSGLGQIWWDILKLTPKMEVQSAV